MSYSDGATLDGLQQVVDRLAGRLGRSVAVDDTRGRLVVASRHFGEEDPLRVYAIVHRVSDPRVMAHFAAAGIYRWDEPGRVPADPDLQFKARVCCPIRDHGILFGHLFLIDDGIPDEQVAQAAAASADIGRLMYRRLALHEEAARAGEAIARDLLAPGVEVRRAGLARAERDGVLVATDPVRVVVVRPVGPTGQSAEGVVTALSAAVESALRDRLRGLGVASVGPHEATVILVGRAAADAAARGAATALVAHLAQAGVPAVAGVGPDVGGAQAPASHEQAGLAARACALLPELGPVASVDDLGAYALLLRLPPDRLRADAYPAPLRRLLDADPTAVLVPSLEAFLDRGGDVTRAAADLVIHRSTLYYRIGRIEEITGLDLRDGGDRLTLHLGLKLRRLVEAL